MPSNKNLIESISKVATEKGVEVPNTVGLNNDKLNETLKGLRALETKPAESTDESAESTDTKPAESTDTKPAESTDESENLTPGSEDSNDASDPEAEEKAQKLKDDKLKAEKAKKEQAKKEAKAEQDAIPPYRIADGKSITSKKGVLTEGDEVKAEYLPGGQETLDYNVDRGFVIKK